MFDALPFDVKPSQDFVQFISEQGNKKDLPNLQLLFNLEKKYPKMFIKVMLNFEDAKSLRETLDENGKPIKISWEEALKKFYKNNKYIGITSENVDIAKVFMGKGLSQDAFERAYRLRQKAKSENIPEHLLGKPLGEPTIFDSIEMIKKQTEQELINGKKLIEDLDDKQFTYEWLNKNDPRNDIIGLFCSGCCTIISNYYGKNIARASVTAPDVQNIVVRDAKGNIVSKGAMYVNKKQGYAVINDFELNDRYKSHETYAGVYDVPETSPDEQEREKIFEAFQRGLRAFIEEYDRQNPNNPLKQINIGMEFNRLKKQVERLKKASSNLDVPREYDFRDAITREQYILYQRPQKQIEDGGLER